MFRLIIALLLSQVLLGCSHLFYYPDARKYADPKKFELDYEPMQFEVTLPESRKGAKDHVSAWYFKAKTNKNCATKPLVIYFHGNAQNISSHFFQLAWLPETGVEFLILDYPGYGESSGEPTRENIHAAMIQVLEKILNAQEGPFKDRRFVIYAQSLGGTILLGLLPKLPSLGKVQHIVIESSFASYQRIARRKLAGIWLTWPLQWLPYVLVSDRYSIDEDYKKLKLPPLTMIHGEDDVVVPFQEGEELFDLMPEPKEFWAVPKANHLQPLHPSFGLRQKLKPIFCAK